MSLKPHDSMDRKWGLIPPVYWLNPYIRSTFDKRSLRHSKGSCTL